MTLNFYPPLNSPRRLRVAFNVLPFAARRPLLSFPEIFSFASAPRPVLNRAVFGYVPVVVVVIVYGPQNSHSLWFLLFNLGSDKA